MMLNDRADNDNKVTPHQSEIMRIFVFKSEANPQPPSVWRRFGWRPAAEAVRPLACDRRHRARPQPSPQPFPRRDRGGYQRARFPALAAEQAVQSDLERDELWFDRHPALAFCLSVIPRVTPEGMLFAKPDSAHRVKARGQAFPDHALVRCRRNRRQRYYGTQPTEYLR